MKHALLLTAAACLSLGLMFSSASAAEPPPNIIVILADDLGWSDLGCFGGEIHTPHIDSLARDGLRFTQFYNNAVCGPTRTSLLTGLYCQQVGHRGDSWNDPVDRSHALFISEALKRAGYRTLVTGKWQDRSSALDCGFDRFFGPMCQNKISYFHEVQQNPFYLDRERWPLSEDFYLTEAINDFSLKFLDEALAARQPFFLYVAHLAPHWPLHARPADIDACRARYRQTGWDECRRTRFLRQQEMKLIPSHWNLLPRPSGIGDWDDDPDQDWQAERMAVHAAMVESMDRGVGRILERLEAAGQVENTVVLFLSDNGAAPNGGLAPSNSGFGFTPGGDNDHWRLDGVAIRPGSGPDNPPGPPDTFAAFGLAWCNVSNTPWRDAKGTAYEGGIRTPLIVRWPRVISSQGNLTDQPGHVIDLLPTFLDMAQIDYPEKYGDRTLLPLEGKSLLPILMGEQRQEHEVLCWSAPRHFAIRSGRWKAIRPRSQDAWELYDLQADATETTNLADQKPARLRELVAQFENWRRRVGDL